jgi:hypothetical protein
VCGGGAGLAESAPAPPLAAIEDMDAFGFGWCQPTGSSSGFKFQNSWMDEN